MQLTFPNPFVLLTPSAGTPDVPRTSASQPSGTRLSYLPFLRADISTSEFSEGTKEPQEERRARVSAFWRCEAQSRGNIH